MEYVANCQECFNRLSKIAIFNYLAPRTGRLSFDQQLEQMMNLYHIKKERYEQSGNKSLVRTGKMVEYPAYAIDEQELSELRKQEKSPFDQTTGRFLSPSGKGELSNRKYLIIIVVVIVIIIVVIIIVIFFVIKKDKKDTLINYS